MRGFAVILGSQTFSSPGNYPVPKGFRSVTATVTPGTSGTPGTPGSPVWSPSGCGFATGPGAPGSPGTPGGTSSFKAAATTTYNRSASTLQPRSVAAVVVGAGGAAGTGGPPGNGCVVGCPPYGGTPGSAGSPGSVIVAVA